jgi:hypothetical protein
MSEDLTEYLAGDSALSRAYRRETLSPPPALDRLVLAAARGGARKSLCLAPLAFAACVLLSCAMVLAVVFAPGSAQRAAQPQLERVRLYSDSAPVRRPDEWLKRIAALRRAGHYEEAAQEMRRFRLAYPKYVIPSEE